MSLVENPKMNSLFNNNLLLVINDIDTYAKSSKEDLYNKCIQQKLKQTVFNYNSELNINLKYILKSYNPSVIDIAKIEKSRDRDYLDNITNKKEK